ncbi:energy transducer TonB [Chryseolinea lacunae]|uniref:TonB family protein n=1 Tax=Chryseolinea lacunae TaxID=2801331 RepID=A0ABS1KTH6_9BACT|nr:energy transducer TonB [Chryseolinea lacunae]MBL0742771.1 TonB family protein [Chryseolinea lacunae]
MKSENEEVTMDDLVFENRNKEYGAYAIRKAYSDNIHKALGFALFASVAAAMLPLVFPSIFPKVPVLPKGPVIIMDLPPNIAQPPAARVAPPPPPAQQRVAANVTPVVTTEEVEVELTQPVVETAVGEGQEVVLAAGPGTTVEAPPAPAVMEPPKPVEWAEVMPKNEGMIRYLQRNLHYPAVARRMGIEGSVYVSFVVNTDGSVMDARVLKGISKECDAEAVRVISAMPAWTAGRQGNTPVMVRMVLPIKFQLN